MCTITAESIDSWHLRCLFRQMIDEKAYTHSIKQETRLVAYKPIVIACPNVRLAMISPCTVSNNATNIQLQLFYHLLSCKRHYVKHHWTYFIYFFSLVEVGIVQSREQPHFLQNVITMAGRFGFTVTSAKPSKVFQPRRSTTKQDKGNRKLFLLLRYNDNLYHIRILNFFL